MKVTPNQFITNLRYFCLIGTIALGLITIVGCNGGGDTTNVYYQDGNGEPSTPTTYTISGQVIKNGTGLSGATLTFSGADSQTTTTDSNGDYSFSAVPSGSYTVAPSLTGYIFDPTSRD